MSDDPGGPSPLRVLQLIGDTDALPAHLAAVELHRGLTALGVEVRTLALAPGNVGGLEEVVPAAAPTRGSLAARTQVTQERRWADVVVLHGSRALGPATLRRRRTLPPSVIALGPFDAGDAPGPDDAGAIDRGAAPGAGTRPSSGTDRTGRVATTVSRWVVSSSVLLVLGDGDRVAAAAERWRRRVEDVRVAVDAQEWVGLLSEVVDRAR